MIKVTTFYKFFPIPEDRLNSLRVQFLKQGHEKNIRGLIIIGTEGINATLSGKESEVENYKKSILSSFPNQKFTFKDSFCKKWNFRRFSVKIKDEIVTTGESVSPLPEKSERLSPKDWEKLLKSEEVQILDVRNDYETDMGKFKNAKIMGIKTFKDFPNRLQELNLNTNQKILIYCTGGIRCEKASEIMKKRGFKNVFQLDGGILNYLKHYPKASFLGDCFVFDHRVGITQNLTPTPNYSLCPHCGQPGKVNIICSHCDKPTKVCNHCLETSKAHKTCSKNCSYHFKARHICHKKFHPFSKQKNSN